MAVEWAQYGIRINSISPGYMMTKMANNEDLQREWLPKIPYNRFGIPQEDLVGAYVYLISDASPYTTGADLIIDGAYTCL